MEGHYVPTCGTHSNYEFAFGENINQERMCKYVEVCLGSRMTQGMVLHL